jgi:hypothetical protein
MLLNWKSDEEHAFIAEVTPIIAQELLSSSLGNRKKRGWYVNLLAHAMKRQEWRVTSQGIGIDRNGHLRDAHHRLYACIESNVPFRSVVVVGLREDAYEVIDTGMRRTLADLRNEDKRISEVVRLGCQYAIGTTKPTVDQTRAIIDSRFMNAVECVIGHCGTAIKFYSSAPMKLAAVITMMNGGDVEYVLGQYKALVTQDYDSMTSCSKALCRQFSNGKTDAKNTRETYTRGLRVFDKDRSHLSKIQISEADMTSSVALARSVVLGE